jgi:hypothetical protein
MSDYIIINGDMAVFQPSFGAATVVVLPGTILGTSESKLNGSALCVDGDESSVSVPGCAYIAGQYTIPGTGTLKIDSLGQDQLTSKMKSGGKAILLKGSNFTAKFEVQVKATYINQSSGATISDSASSYSGQGSLISTNVKFKGS